MNLIFNDINMKPLRLPKRIAALFVLLFSVSFLSAQSLTVEAPQIVARNEVFKVVFSTNTDVESFSRPAISGATVLAGPIPQTFHSTSFVNGKRSESYQFSYIYTLQASELGKVKISPASVVIKGKTYSSKSVTIEVVAAQKNNSGNQGQAYSGDPFDDFFNDGSPSGNGHGTITASDLFLKLSLNKTRVVKGEAIVAVLKLYVNPGIGVSGFEDIKFPVFNGFWSQEIQTPQTVNFSRENYHNKIYNSAVLRKYVLIPQQSGNIKIGTSELVCQLRIGSSGGGNSIFDDFFDHYQTVKKRVVTSPIMVHVLPLPSGAPASFKGGVGHFSMKASLSRDSVRAHEAASVNVVISGEGNLNLIEKPDLRFPADFESYDVKTNNNFNSGIKGSSGSKSFEYPFIPRSKGNFVIPPVIFSYYDVEAKRYRTIASDSLRFKVTKGDDSTAGPVIQGIDKKDVATLGNDIRYIVTASPHLVRRGAMFVAGWLFYMIIILIMILYLFTNALFLRMIKLRGDVRRTKNRKANKIAGARLRKAKSFMKDNDMPQFYEELHKALLGYVSDKLSIQFADMQRETIQEILQEKGVSSESIKAFTDLLDICEMERYSPKAEEGAMGTIYEKAIDVISNLENKL